MAIELKDIEAARLRIKDYIQETQVSQSRSASTWIGRDVFFKYENEQRTGSFKIRGAMNKIASLSKDELARGIVACSAGNHAQGVAFSAAALGSKAYIVMPENTPIMKVSATRGYGAEVILHGEIFDEAYQKAQELASNNGYTFVHPFNDSLVMAGQGTIGLEILEKLADLDSVVVPIGGGGLISGIATAIKELRPQVKIFGVCPANAPGMHNLYKGFASDPKERKPTIADGLAVKMPNPQICEDYLNRLVDDVCLVEEEEIAEAIVFLLERAKSVAEGSGAASLAAAAKMKTSWKLGKKTCILLSGGNIDLNLISSVIDRGLAKKGRLTRIQLVVEDRPGNLYRLTEIIAQQRANILQVHHDRLASGVGISETLIEFVLETRGEEHRDKLLQELKAFGANVNSIK